MRFAPKCRANLFSEQVGEDLLEKIFCENEKKAAFGRKILSKVA